METGGSDLGGSFSFREKFARSLDDLFWSVVVVVFGGRRGFFCYFGCFLVGFSLRLRAFRWV